MNNQTQELSNDPKNSRLMSRIRFAKVSPYIYPGLKITLVQNPSDKIRLIKEVLQKYHGLTFEDANVFSRKRKLVNYRFHFIFLVLRFTNYSLKGVGMEFKKIGYKNTLHHSTIIHARATWQDLVDTSRDIASIHNKALTELNNLIK